MLASGGMATVHLGRLIAPVAPTERWKGLARTVAIKRLRDQFAYDPHFVSALLDEARLTARIRHPNVVETLDVVEADEQLLLVMEYVHGESLSRLLRASEQRAERVPLPIAVAIMAGVLHGLHAAHEATSERGEPLHIVHRDVSPQNIMVGVDGVARVLDFGVAKAVDRLQDTRTGQLKGKASYMAPEQLRSEAVDRRTDVFAASIVLWEVLVSMRLFGGESEGATMEKLLYRDIEPPSRHAPTVSPAFDAVVMRGLSRDPAARFPTARDMAVALEQLGPMATAAEVGSWVRSLAEEVLKSRAERVAEIERAPSTTPKHSSMAPTSSGVIAALSALDDLPTLQPRSVADAFAAHLAVYLGQSTSAVAVKTFSMKAVGRGPETLTPADVPALQAALRPMLRTFIGRERCELVLREIARELGAPP
jgi:serine/threonine-protein kinase